jgi:peptidoglycan hydrolase-like protein with peptidoglycan-binding domain
MGDSGAVVLGLLGTAAGVLAVDYAFSNPGDSWVSKLTSPLLHPLPPSPSLSLSRSARATRPPVAARRSSSVGPAPFVVTPALVNQVAAKLNLPASGLVTEDMKRSLAALQRQLGVSPTGFPDQKTIQALGIQIGQLGQLGQQAQHTTQQAARRAKATLATDAGNFISKTFGGPPSAPSTGPDEGVRKMQHMLNTFFHRHAIDEDGMMGPLTSGLIQEFQTAQGLPKTGTIDSKTHDKLESLVAQGSSLLASTLQRTGVDADSWKAEIQSLGQAAQDVISRVLSEHNPRTMLSVSNALKAAGYTQAAAAMTPQPHAATAATGWYPGPW